MVRGATLGRGRNFCGLQNVHSLLGVRPALGYTGGLSSGVKRPKSETDLSPLSGFEFTSEWSCISISPECFHGVESDSFTIGVSKRNNSVC